MLLLRENQLDEDLLAMFWSLTRSDYQAEVFKIISDQSYHLKQVHVDYLFGELTS